MNKLILSVLLLVLIACIGQSKKKPQPAAKKTVEQSVSKKIYYAIQPLGYYANTDLIKLATEIKNFYHQEVLILPTMKIPQRFYDDTKSPRYSADSILHLLKINRPDSVKLTSGVTHSDLFTTVYEDDGTIKEPVWKYKIWGIFGLGYEPGPYSVISDFRLKCEDSRQLFRRTRNVVLHEIGHNLGLSHCSDKKCFMAGANESIKSVDYEGDNLCKPCKQKLESRK